MDLPECLQYAFTVIPQSRCPGRGVGQHHETVVPKIGDGDVTAERIRERCPHESVEALKKPGVLHERRKPGRRECDSGGYRIRTRMLHGFAGGV
jgi:hypothetical protein